MRNIIISMINAVKHEIDGSDCYYILCTTSPVQAAGEHVLLLPFADTEDPDGPDAFQKEDAKDLLEFVKNVPIDSDLFVCCDSGESRSAAIAAALCRWQRQDDSFIWNDPHYHPNGLVFRMVCDCFNVRIDEAQLVRLKRRSADALGRGIWGT